MLPTDMRKVRKIETIPDYLKTYIAQQNPSLYTAIDQASWRFILRVSQSFFSRHAHQKYLDGLKETGISIERIPLIQEMDQCLRAFGWQAVAVTGFIPPAVFMEFLSLGVLPIACDMRTLDHIAYTPAPDIVHEAAGHAPIIADPEYADYLRSYGEISRKAIFSIEDLSVYHAVRYLSDIKENPSSTPEKIQEAQTNLDRAIASVTYVSEATLLSRMGWWTFEYGLVGDLSKPKIFGAGLLSSLGESYHCLSSKVKKIPFSVDCIQTSYDITRPQPQLFVTPDFSTLKAALEELASQMAFRKGGIEGLEKARNAQTPTTVVLDSGIQISGVLDRVHLSEIGAPCYLQYKGPTQISFEDKEVQSATYHAEGFGTPLVSLTLEDLERAGFSGDQRRKIELGSGIVLEGKKVDFLSKKGCLLLVTFEDCEVRKGAEILFRPEWGRYDMVCGEKVVSVFGGAADRQKYLDATGGFKQDPGRQKTNLTDENRQLDQLYARVRKLREAGDWKSSALAELTQIHEELEKLYPRDWLLRFELFELCSVNSLNLPWKKTLVQRLEELARDSQEKNEIIQRGFESLKEVQSVV